MKNTLVMFAAMLLTLASVLAFAGDEPVTTIYFETDGGTQAVCSSLLRQKMHYAVQPTVASFIRAQDSTSTDGGVRSVGTQSVKIGADILYDVYTAAGQTYICAKPVAASAADGGVNIFQNREAQE